MMRRPLLALLLLTGCAGAPSEQIDLTGLWQGTHTSEERLVTSMIELLSDGSGSWRFVDVQGEGTATVLDDRSRTVRIRLSQRTPCSGTYGIDALLADVDVLEGTIEGSDCARTLSSTIQLRRTAR